MGGSNSRSKSGSRSNSNSVTSPVKYAPPQYTKKSFRDAWRGSLEEDDVGMNLLFKDYFKKYHEIVFAEASLDSKTFIKLITDEDNVLGVLKIAVENNYLHIMKFIFGKDEYDFSTDIAKLMKQAAARGYYDIVRFLVQHGGDVNSLTKDQLRKYFRVFNPNTTSRPLKDGTVCMVLLTPINKEETYYVCLQTKDQPIEHIFSRKTVDEWTNLHCPVCFSNQSDESEESEESEEDEEEEEEEEKKDPYSGCRMDTMLYVNK